VPGRKQCFRTLSTRSRESASSEFESARSDAELGVERNQGSIAQTLGESFSLVKLAFALFKPVEWNGNDQIQRSRRIRERLDRRIPAGKVEPQPRGCIYTWIKPLPNYAVNAGSDHSRSTHRLKQGEREFKPG